MKKTGALICPLAKLHVIQLIIMRITSCFPPMQFLHVNFINPCLKILLPLFRTQIGIFLLLLLLRHHFLCSSFTGISSLHSDRAWERRRDQRENETNPWEGNFWEVYIQSVHKRIRFIGVWIFSGSGNGLEIAKSRRRYEDSLAFVTGSGFRLKFPGSTLFTLPLVDACKCPGCYGVWFRFRIFCFGDAFSCESIGMCFRQFLNFHRN